MAARDDNVVIGWRNWLSANNNGHWNNPESLFSGTTFDRATLFGSGVSIFPSVPPGHYNGDAYAAMTGFSGIERWEGLSLLAPPGNSPFIDGETVGVIKAIDQPFAATYGFSNMGVVVYRSTLGTFEIAVAAAGMAMRIPSMVYEGVEPIRWSDDSLIRTNISASGEFLGKTVIRRGRRGRMRIRNVPAEFVRSADFRGFLEHARTRAFFLWWRPLTYPDEVEYVWTRRPPRIRNTGPAGLMSIDLDLRAYRPS